MTDRAFPDEQLQQRLAAIDAIGDGAEILTPNTPSTSIQR